VLKILPRAMARKCVIVPMCSAPLRWMRKGWVTTGMSFYDRIQRMSEERRLASTLLGHVVCAMKSAICVTLELSFDQRDHVRAMGWWRIADNF